MKKNAIDAAGMLTPRQTEQAICGLMWIVPQAFGASVVMPRREHHVLNHSGTSTLGCARFS